MEHSSITESPFRTAGLLSRECGQIGVTQTADNEGSSIGPPADKEYAVDPGEFLTKGRATPFEGMRVFGRCLLTSCGGETVFVDNKLLK